MLFRPSIGLLLFGAVLVASSEVSSLEVSLTRDTSFDYLVFAQGWPETNCIEWKERSRSNKCFLPSKSRWTVHGVWPTKTGTHGPFNCNPTLKFDSDKIKDILPDLESHWTNVHANTEEFSFWEHEWSKHGTCAAQLAPLSDEHKYFAKGVALSDQFPLGKYLEEASIVPGDETYWFNDVLAAVQKGLDGKQPLVQCAYDKKIKGHYLSQIEICLDKDLNAMSCPGNPNHGCPPNGHSIAYPTPETVADFVGGAASEKKEGIFRMDVDTVRLLLIGLVFALLAMSLVFLTACICCCCRSFKSNKTYGRLNEVHA